ncbi:MAG: transposase [Firmicutes bacterium]|nr:transposase [Alicyclobacillaceae bacterium]MCL6498318.1 transposase [Bacillota bacterium]
MAGLNLTQQSSGHHPAATHISKRGQPAVRCALYQAAVVAMAKDAGWRAWYQRLVQRAESPLSRKAALIAVACKLLRVAWACARQQTPYDAQRFAQASGVAG